VASLSVQDAPKPKSKNLNVLDEFKKADIKNSASFVVVGKWPPILKKELELMSSQAMLIMERVL
jgi:hypothetical protein